jgi:hypothetical protein
MGPQIYAARAVAFHGSRLPATVLGARPDAASLTAGRIGITHDVLVRVD